MPSLSAPASADDHTGRAYVCFVKHDAKVIELNGGRPRAMDRAPVGAYFRCVKPISAVSERADAAM